MLTVLHFFTFIYTTDTRYYSSMRRKNHQRFYFNIFIKFQLFVISFLFFFFNRSQHTRTDDEWWCFFFSQAKVTCILFCSTMCRRMTHSNSIITPYWMGPTDSLKNGLKNPNEQPPANIVEPGCNRTLLSLTS